MKQEKEGLSPLTGYELQILCQSSKTMQEGWASEFKACSVRLQVIIIIVQIQPYNFAFLMPALSRLAVKKKNKIRSSARKNEEKLEIT